MIMTILKKPKNLTGSIPKLLPLHIKHMLIFSGIATL